MNPMFGPPTSIRRLPLMTEIDTLDDVLASFLADHSGTVIGASRVMNPLLAVWEAAHTLSETAALPVERMLTVLVKRQHTSHDELARMVDDVREAVQSDMGARPVPAVV
jgi:hypothetical protein